MSSTQEAPPTALPVDIETMRDTVNRLLDPDAAPDAFPPAGDELQTLTATVRGHIAVLAPEVEEAARTKLKPGTVRKYTVLQCAWEARGRLDAEPSSKSGGAVAHARRLARSLNALCDHYERLGGAWTPEQLARLRMGDHAARCPTCRTADDQGVNMGLNCTENNQLFEAWQRTRHGGTP